jgi:hypothetical protein
VVKFAYLIILSLIRLKKYVPPSPELALQILAVVSMMLKLSFNFPPSDVPTCIRAFWLKVLFKI